MKNKWWFGLFGIAGVILAISLFVDLVNRDYLSAFGSFVLLVALGLNATGWYCRNH